MGDVKAYFDAGADKITLNTGAVENPALITEIAEKYGSQSVVVSIDTQDGEVIIDCGRQYTALDSAEWAQEVVERGAGEILLNTIERDGSLSGYDLDLYKWVANAVTVPVLFLGGAGSWRHFHEGAAAGASGVCTQNIYHFASTHILAAKQYLHDRGIPVRL